MYRTHVHWVGNPIGHARMLDTSVKCEPLLTPYEHDFMSMQYFY